MQLVPAGLKIITMSNYARLIMSSILRKRVGKPADIARTCLFLADEQNDFITGQNIVVDRGMTKKMIYE